MPNYPQRPRLGNSNEELLPQPPRIPQVSTPGAFVPQVTSGAPEIPEAWREPMAIFDRIKGIPRPPGAPGPQDWDRPTREIFPTSSITPGRTVDPPYIPGSEPGPSTPDVPNTPYVPNISISPTWPLEEVRRQYPDAVNAFTKLLEEKRKIISPEQATGTFWKQFDEASQGSAAQFLSTILALLQGGQSAQPLQLSEMQTQWVRQHPVTRWLNWLPKPNNIPVG